MEEFTHKSVRDMRASLPDDDPTNELSADAFLRKMLHESMNVKAPKLLHKLFPGFAIGEGGG